MSGIEIAGLVLGAIPLVISALENYQAGKGAMATMFKFRGLLDKLIRQLRSEQVFFYTKILVLLREARVAQARDTIDPTEDECIRISQDVRAGREIKDYLGQVYEPFMEILGQYEKCLKTLAGALGHLLRPKSASKDDLDAIIKANSDPNTKMSLSFRGKLEFTIKYKSLLTILVDLQRERSALDRLIVDTKILRDIDNSDASRTSKKLSQVFSDVQCRAEALFTAMCNSYTSCRCRDKHSVMMQLNNHIPDRFGQAHQLLGIGERRDDLIFSLFIPTEDGHYRETTINVATLTTDNQPQKGSEDHDKGTREVGVVLPTVTVTAIVTPTYSSTIVSASTGPSITEAQVAGLCQYAKQARTLDEILALRLTGDRIESMQPAGSFIGTRKSPRTVIGAITLADFLRDTLHDEDAKLTPKQRTLLALDVASSVLQLRQTLWCSTADAWTKTSVKFLVQGRPCGVLCTPFVEQHIHKNQQPSTSHHDMTETLLNLAILLLEIWHHTSFETWLRRPPLNPCRTQLYTLQQRKYPLQQQHQIPALHPSHQSETAQ